VAGGSNIIGKLSIFLRSCAPVYAHALIIHNSLVIEFTFKNMHQKNAYASFAAPNKTNDSAKRCFARTLYLFGHDKVEIDLVLACLRVGLDTQSANIHAGCIDALADQVGTDSEGA
jgi:hypothetical protein